MLRFLLLKAPGSAAEGGAAFPFLATPQQVQAPEASVRPVYSCLALAPTGDAKDPTAASRPPCFP